MSDKPQRIRVLPADAGAASKSDAEAARLPSAVERRLKALEDAVEQLRGRPPDGPSERERHLTTLEAEGRQRITELSEALAAVERSASWRVTAPFRAAERALPPSMQRALHHLIRGAYWAMTPHRMMARLRSFSYVPLIGQAVRRLDYLSTVSRQRLGMPLRRAYGPSPVEGLDIFAAAQPRAPVFVFVHGGAWREGEAKDYAFPAEMFTAAGAHYVATDFIAIREAGGDLRVMAEQVRRAVAWVHRNAASFGGDPDRIYIGGHSSGGHLCGVALATDWQGEFGVPADVVKGALLMSGVFDLQPVRRSGLNPYLRFTDEIETAMSPIRHVGRLDTPVVITCGSNETPEFRGQSRGFWAALQAAGKPAEFVEATGFGHMEMLESFGNPYGPNGRAALALMRLSPG